MFLFCLPLTRGSAETLPSQLRLRRDEQTGTNSFSQTLFLFAILLFGLRLIFLRGYKFKGWWVSLIIEITSLIFDTSPQEKYKLI